MIEWGWAYPYFPLMRIDWAYSYLPPKRINWAYSYLPPKRINWAYSYLLPKRINWAYFYLPPKRKRIGLAFHPWKLFVPQLRNVNKIADLIFRRGIKLLLTLQCESTWAWHWAVHSWSIGVKKAKAYPPFTKQGKLPGIYCTLRLFLQFFTDNDLCWVV